MLIVAASLLIATKTGFDTDKTTVTTSGADTICPSEVTDFTPGFYWLIVAQSLDL